MEQTMGGLGISRRQLFGMAASMTVPVYLAGGTRRAVGRHPAPSGAGALSLAGFSAAVGSRFRVRTGSFRFVDLVLVEADAHPERTGGAVVTGESFSLIFGGDGREDVEAGIHRVGHPAFGWFPLSLAPVGMARRGQRYEAVVNRRQPVSR